MNIQSFRKVVIAISIVLFPAVLGAAPVPQSPPNIGVDGRMSVNEVSRGRSGRAVVTMEIPAGYHVNSNRPLEKFLIPTQLQIQASNGVRVGPVSYPRAVVRRFKFSKTPVSVFEGRPAMRFSVIVPASFGGDSTELKAKVEYQSCNDEVCFPPQTREFSIWVKIK